MMDDFWEEGNLTAGLIMASLALMFIAIGITLGTRLEQRRHKAVVEQALDDCEDACNPQPKEFK